MLNIDVDTILFNSPMVLFAHLRRLKNQRKTLEFFKFNTLIIKDKSVMGKSFLAGPFMIEKLAEFVNLGRRVVVQINHVDPEIKQIYQERGIEMQE